MVNKKKRGLRMQAVSACQRLPIEPPQNREYEKNSVKTESKYSEKVFYDKIKKSQEALNYGKQKKVVYKPKPMTEVFFHSPAKAGDEVLATIATIANITDTFFILPSFLSS